MIDRRRSALSRWALNPPASHMTHTGTAEQNIKHTHTHTCERRECTKWRHRNESFSPVSGWLAWALRCERTAAGLIPGSGTRGRVLKCEREDDLAAWRQMVIKKICKEGKDYGMRKALRWKRKTSYPAPAAGRGMVIRAGSVARRARYHRAPALWSCALHPRFSEREAQCAATNPWAHRLIIDTQQCGREG